MDIKKWLNSLRDKGTHVREENAATCNLTYTVSQLYDKLLGEPDGPIYIEHIQASGPELERQGVCTIYKKGGMLYCNIPSWVRFMRALRDWELRRQQQIEWCRNRTSSGNVYAREKDAMVACKVIGDKSGNELTYYQCHQCSKYHLKRKRHA